MAGSKKKPAKRTFGRAGNAEALRERQASARANEVCLWCSEPAEPGKTLCTEHLAEQRSKYEATRASGLCVRCKQPADGGAMCAGCRAKDAERKRARRAARASKRAG
jgi:hypothetical protein